MEGEAEETEVRQAGGQGRSDFLSAIVGRHSNCGSVEGGGGGERR